MVISMFIMIMSIGIQKSINPFSLKHLNSLEIKSLISNFFTIFFSLVLQERISTLFSFLCTIMIVFFNFLFIFDLFIKILILFKIRRLFSRLSFLSNYLLISCFRKCVKSTKMKALKLFFGKIENRLFNKTNLSMMKNRCKKLKF